MFQWFMLSWVKGRCGVSQNTSFMVPCANSGLNGDLTADLRAAGSFALQQSYRVHGVFGCSLHRLLVEIAIVCCLMNYAERS